MLEKLPIKKEYLLIVASVIFLLLSYQLAFKATVSAWQAHRQLKAGLTRSGDISYQPGYQERKIVNLGKVIDLYKADTSALRNNSINTMAGIAEKEGVKLSEVPAQDPFYRTGQFMVQRVAFEGNFFALERVLQQLQATGNIGMLRCISFKTTGIKSNLDEQKKLVLEVYLEISRL